MFKAAINYRIVKGGGSRGHTGGALRVLNYGQALGLPSLHGGLPTVGVAIYLLNGVGFA
jgi:hypothetical protein